MKTTFTVVFSTKEKTGEDTYEYRRITVNGVDIPLTVADADLHAALHMLHGKASDTAWHDPLSDEIVKIYRGEEDHSKAAHAFVERQGGTAEVCDPIEVDWSTFFGLKTELEQIIESATDPKSVCLRQWLPDLKPALLVDGAIKKHGSKDLDPTEMERINKKLEKGINGSMIRLLEKILG